MSNTKWCDQYPGLCRKQDLFLVIDDVFNSEQFQLIKNTVDKNDKKLVKCHAADRYKKIINSKKITALFIDKMKTILNSIGLDSEVRKSKIPLEYRVYKEKSKGMSWHRDTIIDKKPQYELIYTINNLSNSKTVAKLQNGNKIKVKTKPNQLIIVMGGGILHRVTPTTNNKKREILKLALLQK